MTLILFISLGLCVYSTGAFADKPTLLDVFADVEARYRIPKGLLLSIGRVESSLNPLALNINGNPAKANNWIEMIRIIRKSQGQGITNIDIGIMQLNMRWHRDEFKLLTDMLDPQKNIEYAARLLVKLKRQHKDWRLALRYYHSANPEHNRKYSKKVVMCWLGLDAKKETSSVSVSQKKNNKLNNKKGVTI